MFPDTCTMNICWSIQEIGQDLINDFPFEVEHQASMIPSNRFVHPEFGEGTIKARDFSDKWKLLIDFDDKGEMWVFASHVKPLQGMRDEEDHMRRQIDRLAEKNDKLRAKLCERLGLEPHKSPPPYLMRPVDVEGDGRVASHAPKDQELKFRKQTGQRENTTRGETAVQNLPGRSEYEHRKEKERKGKAAFKRWARAGFPGRKKDEEKTKTEVIMQCRNCDWKGKEPDNFICPVCEQKDTLFRLRKDGELAERMKAPDLKPGMEETPSGVRIPRSPQDLEKFILERLSAL